VVDLDAAFGEQLFDVAVGEAMRRYQRTASTITSGEKQNPAKADRGMGSGRTRRVLMTSVWLLGSAHSRCNSAQQPAPARDRRGRSPGRPVVGHVVHGPVELDEVLVVDRRIPWTGMLPTTSGEQQTTSDDTVRTGVILSVRRALGW
jgi:hypothetical protein